MQINSEWLKWQRKCIFSHIENSVVRVVPESNNSPPGTSLKTWILSIFLSIFLLTSGLHCPGSASSDSSGQWDGSIALSRTFLGDSSQQLGQPSPETSWRLPLLFLQSQWSGLSMPDLTTGSRVVPKWFVDSSFGTGMCPPAARREMLWASGKWESGGHSKSAFA